MTPRGSRKVEEVTASDDWIGAIPVGWRVAPVKRLAECDNSGAWGEERGVLEVDCPVATTAQISPSGGLRVEEMPVRSFSLADYERYVCRPGDIVIVKSSGSASSIVSGKAAMIRPDTPPFVFSNFLMRVRPAQHRLLPELLYAFLTSHVMRERIRRMVSATTYPNLRVEEYTSSLVPIPPWSQQRAIADYLDAETARIDALIEKKRRMIELLEERARGLFVDEVSRIEGAIARSGVPWLPRVPTGWPIIRLSFVARLLNGTTPDRENPAYWGGDVPWLASSVVSHDEVLEPTEYVTGLALAERPLSYAPKGSVLVALYGQGKTRGSSAILRFDATFNQALVAIVPSQRRLLPDFLHQLLSASYETLRSLGQGGQQPNLNTEQLAAWRIPVPPRDEQQSIIDRVRGQRARGERQRSALGRSIELLVERRQALITAAVTGVHSAPGAPV